MPMFPAPPSQATYPLAWFTSLLTLLPCMPAQADEHPLAIDALQVRTATRTERLLSDIPIRTEVLSQSDIELRASLNLSQAMELFNGIRVESNCQNCNTSEVQLLGLGGGYNQLLFDGIPLLSTLGGVYGLEQIPTAFVNRIEVVKGGGSALYGPGAVAGVINLIPLEPQRDGGFLQGGIEVQKGEPIYYTDGRLDRILDQGRLGLSLVFQGSRNQAIDFNGDDYSEVTRKSLGMLGLQSWYAPNTDTKLRANYQYTREDRRGGNRLGQPEYLSNIAESLETRYHRGSLAWDQILSDRLDFHLSYAFAHIERDSFYGGLGNVATDTRTPDYDPEQLDPFEPGSAASVSYNQYGFTRNPLQYVDTQFNLAADDHALAFGLQYKHERILDENRNARGQRLNRLTDDSFSNLGLYLQDEWHLSERLELVLGGRLDKSSELDKVVFSPRLAGAFALTDAFKLRAGISTGFRAPEVFDEDLHVDTLGAEQVRIRNADDLKEERALTYMGGFDWNLGRWSWDTTLSYTELKDAFALGEIHQDTLGRLYQIRSNAEGSQVLGVESNLHWQIVDTLRLSTGAAWYRSRYDQAQVVFDDRDEGGDTLIRSRDYLKTPRWSGIGQLQWTPSDAWDAFIGVKYTGKMHVLNNNTGLLEHTRDFWVIDSGFTRRFRFDGQTLSVSAGIKNLLDHRQRDLEKGADRDSDYVYGPRFARSFHTSVRYDW